MASIPLQSAVCRGFMAQIAVLVRGDLLIGGYFASLVCDGAPCPAQVVRFSPGKVAEL